MMSDAVVTAVNHLQTQALQIRDSYGLERIERALDELLRQPQKEKPTPHLVRSALGHAYETIERRKAIAPHRELTAGTREPAGVETTYTEIEMADWVRRQDGLATADRSLLLHLAAGDDAMTLAAKSDVPLTRMRERISRCRRQARRLWNATGDGA